MNSLNSYLRAIFTLTSGITPGSRKKIEHILSFDVTGIRASILSSLPSPLNICTKSNTHSCIYKYDFFKNEMKQNHTCLSAITPICTNSAYDSGVAFVVFGHEIHRPIASAACARK